jgi:hypothetical protein
VTRREELKEAALLALGLIGFCGLMALGPIGALIVIGYEMEWFRH